MFNWLNRALRSLLARYESRRRLSLNNFQEMVQDIRYMADISERLWIQDAEFQERLRKIRGEMDQLDKLLAMRSFATLSVEKKKELHKGLELSREELLKSIRSAPCPTERIQ